MKLYGGIDLHSNNSVIVILDEKDKAVYKKKHKMIYWIFSPACFPIGINFKGW